MTKYIGPKTDGENVATQADKLSLSSETPDALTPDQAGAAGTATTAARSDHQHEILAGAAGTITPDAASAEGSSTSFARADHTHAIVAASAGTITGTNAEGTSTSFARADHNHALGTGVVTASAVEAAEAWNEIGSSGKPSFQNSWVNYDGGFATAAYYKDHQGRVYLKGLIKSGTRGQTVFNLPSGYRPAEEELFVVVSNSQMGQVNIPTNGNLFVAATATGSNAFVSLSGISFRAA